MRYFLIFYAVNAPTWDTIEGHYPVANAEFPSDSAIAFHVRKIHNAPTNARVILRGPIQELKAADYKAFIA